MRGDHYGQLDVTASYPQFTLLLGAGKPKLSDKLAAILWGKEE